MKVCLHICTLITVFIYIAAEKETAKEDLVDKEKKIEKKEESKNKSEGNNIYIYFSCYKYNLYVLNE